MTDESELGLTAAEKEELEQFEALLRAKDHFELSETALQRGLVELDALLDRKERRKATSKRVLWLLVPFPLAAALLVHWSAGGKDFSPASPELVEAQSALLTAKLTGAPLPRDDLEAATRSYRQALLARLERP